MESIFPQKTCIVTLLPEKTSEEDKKEGGGANKAGRNKIKTR